MTGIEFSVENRQPPICVIQKQFRTGPAPNEINIIAIYYISDAKIYQAPTIYSISSKILVPI
jgi:hypothetical protein